MASEMNIAAAANPDTSLKCLTRSVKGDSTANFLVDNNYDNGKNPYYKKDVATIYYSTSFETYNNPKCGSGFCTISMMIQNLIGKEFTFGGSFNYGGMDTTIATIVVPAKGNTDLGKIFTIHCLSSCEPSYVSFKLKGNISYN